MNWTCPRCGARGMITVHDWRCACGQPFLIADVPPLRRDSIIPEATGVWRYRNFMPRLDGPPVTMGEGNTPLVFEDWDGIPIGLKLDFLCPTGSFKDRGLSVLSSYLRSYGVREVLDDSSGNAGVALAAYGARAGLRVHVYVPASTSAAKLAQLRAYGANVVAVTGPRSRASEEALAAVKAGTCYATHAYHPLMAEGVATYAYELLEQMNWRPPDTLIVPMGHGSLVVGAYLAFRRAQDAGLIERLPRFVIVQSAACAPVVSAWEQGREDLLAVSPTETVAEGISIARPAWGWFALRVLRETGGLAVAVDEDSILRAHTKLAHRGIYVEPTSAVPLAAIEQIRPMLHPTELIIVPLTGHGLKHH